jgi:hypothetical protein
MTAPTEPEELEATTLRLGATHAWEGILVATRAADTDLAVWRCGHAHRREPRAATCAARELYRRNRAR